MGKLVVHQNLVTKENAPEIQALCPFGAITYENDQLDISSACKMCKLCVKKSGGVVTYEEETKKSVDKSLWTGICVYVDHMEGTIHRVTYELLGKAKELAKVTGHPVYALMMGSAIGNSVEKLLHYGVDKVFVYDKPELKDFRIEPYTACFCDFIEKEA